MTGTVRKGAPNGEWLFGSYLRATPLLWVFGVLTPAGALLLIRLAWLRWPRGRAINTVVGFWCLIGATQAMATLTYGVLTGATSAGVRNLLAFGVVGWVFGGLAIAVGAGYQLNGATAIRATTWLGGGIIVLALVASVARMRGASDLYIWPTPASMLLPNSTSVDFYTAALVFQTEETFGEVTTRLVTFFPYATGLGLGGLAICLISLHDRNWRFRIIGSLGGAIGVVFSWSRIAIACLAVAAIITLFLRMSVRWRLVPIGMCVIAFTALSMCGVDLVGKVQRFQTDVDNARAGSTLARELIYQKSWEGFLQSPIIGNGWIGASVHPKEELPIGSHSTVYGLLYTGGAVTFGAFAFAMLTTLMVVGYKLLRTKFGTPERARLLTAFCLAVGLLLYCPYESLFSLTLPCLFLFTWIGACIAEPNPELRQAVLVRPLLRSPDMMKAAAVPTQQRITA
jgi:O-Antigen ligase